jgi:hypothetical protein
MQRIYKFIVVFFLLAFNFLTATAQESSAAPLLIRTSVNGKEIRTSPLSARSVEMARALPASITSSFIHYRSLAPDFYLKTLGFVCKAEYRIEKKLNLPLALRLRVGSLEYVNKLEGKR